MARRRRAADASPGARGKRHLPTKPCRACGRDFAWRKKWARDWDRVLYCSDRCRRSKPPTQAEPDR